MRRISAYEFRQWYAYEQVYGSLSSGERIDQSAALISERITNTSLPSNAKPATPETFLPQRNLDDGDTT